MFKQLLFALALALTACTPSEDPQSPPETTIAPAPGLGPIKVAATDGIEIAATVHAAGELTVVLVHGWMCDQTYWDAQVPTLAEHYGVVTVDVAGHGLSGLDRQSWTIASLGEDVAGVISHLELERVVVVGHSMGGRIGLEAARLMPGVVTAVVGVDSLHDAGQEMSPDDTAGFLEGFETAFKENCNGFVGSMFGDRASENMKTAITSDMCSGPGAIGTALLRDYVAYDLAAALQAAGVPVRSINADKWPTNAPANQEFADFEVVIIEGHGHFLMQEAPEELNRALIGVVGELDASH